MIVRCVITTAGATQDCHIVQSVPLMDEAVLTYLSRHRSVPVLYRGHPINVEYKYYVRFKQPPASGDP